MCSFFSLRRKLMYLSVALLGLLLATPAAAQAQEGPGNGNASPRAGEVIPGEYIVVLHDDVTNVRGMANELARAYGLQLGHIYSVGLKGFAAKIPDALVAALADDPDVAYVEPDQWMQVVGGHTVPTGVQRIFAEDNTNIMIDDNDDYRVDVDIATIDTGIDLDHPDLNVVSDVNCMNESGGGPPWARTVSCEPGGDDDHYHGTHVSGTMAAIDNDFGVVGVAPGARLHAVKVLDQNGSGKNSWVIAGVEYVTANAGTIEVANMSLGGGNSQALCDAIADSVAAGVTYAVAAGNSDDDAANYSPANCSDVITVSALADSNGLEDDPDGDPFSTCRSDEEDTLANFSNWGSTVEVTAPGVCILSTFPLEQGEYGTISGTSMASPHVAGAAALLAATDPTLSPAQIAAIIIATGNFNWTDDSGDGNQEPLLDVSDPNTYNPATVAGPGGGGNALPVADAGPDQTVPDSDGLDGEVVTLDGSGSSDSDGTVDNYLWMEGATVLYNGASSIVDVPLADGIHTLTLTVTDNLGATDSDEVVITVEAPAGGGDITLTATGRKVRGTKFVDLVWSEATSAIVDVWRNSSLAFTTENDGTHTDNLGRGGGTYTYKLCNEGTNTCSNETTVTF